MSTATLSSSGARRHPLLAFFTSSVGKKFLVAITGVALILFLIGHLLGNLTIFAGQDAINTYAVKLRELGPLLWAARIGLLVAVAIHIWTTVQLTLENRKARPVGYAVRTHVQSTLFARTMRVSGVVILAFVIFHLAHFTWFWVHPEWRNLHDPQGRHDVYSMVILGFSNPVVSAFYALALGLLCFHLSHGIASVFQTLGWSNQTTRPLFEKGGLLFSWALFAGYVSIPLAVLFRFITLPNS